MNQEVATTAVLLPKNTFFNTSNFKNGTSHKRIKLSTYLCNNKNITFQQNKVTREERSIAFGQHEGFRGCTLWFTGLSGAGKTTISFALEKTLTQLGVPCYGLDGDNVRHGLCKNLSFSTEDRHENIRRVAEVSKLFADMGVITLASFISPFRSDREEARSIHEADGIKFFEIYVNTPLDICEARDPKKLYKKVRSGLLKNFTGIDSVYEEPLNPDFVIDAGNETEIKSVQSVLQFLCDKEILPQKAINQLNNQSVRQLFVVDETQKFSIIQEAKTSPRINLTIIDLQWLQVLSEGWASPLSGFMRERQYLQSLHYGQLFDLEKNFNTINDFKKFKNFDPDDCKYSICNSINQSIPIVLPIDDTKKTELENYLIETNNNLIPNHTCNIKYVPFVNLFYNDELIAVMKNAEIYPHRKQERIHRQFGFSDLRHPAIAIINNSGDWLIGGDLKVFKRIQYNDGLDEYRKTPLELCEIFTNAKCDAVFAFQLRNPIHNGHVLLMRKTRAELLKKYKNPMLLLHPLGGWTKDDDVPLKVRIEQHKAIIESKVLDPTWTILAIFPSPMLYAGPTEVQWHARARLACGIKAYIVGRDPAGIQNPDNGDFLYDPTHGGKILSMAPGLSNLEILPFHVAAYDKKKKKMDFYDSNRKNDFFFISGTMMRNYAKKGEEPPEGFMEPNAWKLLASYYANNNLKKIEN